MPFCQIEKRYCPLNRLEPFFVFRLPTSIPSVPGHSQSSARRMHDDNIPSSLNNRDTIALYVVMTIVVGLEQVTRPCIMSKLAKSLSHDSAKLAGYQYFHSNSPITRFITRMFSLSTVIDQAALG